MILKDEKLQIRAIEESDAQGLLEMINDKETEDWVIGWSFPVSKHDQLQWIMNTKNQGGNVKLAIDSGKGFLGLISLTNLDFKNRTGALGIKLRKCARGNGYAKGAMKMLIKYCFEELNLNCLTAVVLFDNASSNALFTSLGFVKEGVLRSRIFKRDKYMDLISYSYTRGDYDKRDWK